MMNKFSTFILLAITGLSLYILFCVGLGWFWTIGSSTNYERINQVLLNLSYSYIAGLIFYILIEYIPKNIAAKKAFTIWESQLVNIYLHMSEIVAEIKLIANITKEDKDIILSDLKDIVKYKPQYKKLYYKSTTFINKIPNKDKTKGVFEFHADLYEAGVYIKKHISEMIKLPSASNITPNLLEIISEIESCKFLFTCNSFKNVFLEDCEYDINSFDKDFYDFLQLYICLGKYKFPQHSYNYEILSQDEITLMEAERKIVLGEIKKTGIKLDNHKFYKNNIEYKIRNGKLI